MKRHKFLNLIIPFLLLSSTQGFAGGLPATFFSQNWVHSSKYPAVPFGTLRLWGTVDDSRGGVGVSWEEIETSKGVYHWGPLDTWLSIADKNDKEVLYTFGRTPSFISMRPTEHCTYGLGCAAPPSDVENGDGTFKAFVTALVNHSLASSTAHIKYYEIWNEPEPTPGKSGTWSGTPAQLAIMAQDAYEIIHNLDPNAKVIGPCAPSGNKWGIHFLPEYYAAISPVPGKNRIPQDYVGIHAYTYLSSGPNAGKFDPTTDQIPTVIGELRALMKKYNIENQQIWFTEGDWGPNNATMSDIQKTAYIAQEHLLMWNGGVSRYFWYAWDNSVWGGLETTKGAISPAGIAYGVLYKWLVGSTASANPCVQGADETWTCSLTLANRNSGKIFWNSTINKTITMPSNFKIYQTLDGKWHTIGDSHKIPITSRPIFVE